MHNYSNYAEYSTNKNKIICCFTLALFQTEIHFHIYSIANMDNIIKAEFEHNYTYQLHIKLMFSIFSEVVGSCCDVFLIVH